MNFRFWKKKETKPEEERFVDEEKAAKRRRRKAKAMLPLYIVLSVFIVAAAIYLALTMLFNVDHFNIEGNTLYEEQKLIETSGIHKGDNLFKIDTDYAEQKLYSVYNYIEDVDVKIDFPNGVSIRITEATPFAVLEEADGYTLVSAKGKVLERGYEEVPYGMVAVRGISTVTENEDDVKRMELLREIIAAMQKFDMEKVGFIDLTDTLEITMICDNRITVRLGNELELEYKLQFVNEILKNKIEKTGYFLVDASTPGEVMTKEMTLSPWDTLETVAGIGFADEDEE